MLLLSIRLTVFLIVVLVLASCDSTLGSSLDFLFTGDILFFVCICILWFNKMFSNQGSNTSLKSYAFTYEYFLTEYAKWSLLMLLQLGPRRNHTSIYTEKLKEDCLQKPNSRFWDHRKIIILSKFPYSDHLSLKTKHLKKSLSFQNI